MTCNLYYTLKLKTRNSAIEDINWNTIKISFYYIFILFKISKRYEVKNQVLKYTINTDCSWFCECNIISSFLILVTGFFGPLHSIVYLLTLFKSCLVEVVRLEFLFFSHFSCSMSSLVRFLFWFKSKRTWYYAKIFQKTNISSFSQKSIEILCFGLNFSSSNKVCQK